MIKKVLKCTRIVHVKYEYNEYEYKYEYEYMAHTFYEYEYKYEYFNNVLEYMSTRVPITSAPYQPWSSHCLKIESIFATRKA